MQYLNNTTDFSTDHRNQPSEFLTSIKLDTATSEEKENKQIAICTSLKSSYRSPLMMQKQTHCLSYVKGKP